jgi:cyclophilin family peptidyl-prolyl cis-trans isomerase
VRVGRLALVALLGALAFAAAGCGGGNDESAATTAATTTVDTTPPATTTTATAEAAASGAPCPKVQAPPANARTVQRPHKRLDPRKTYDLVLKTNCGTFAIRLDPKQSPGAVESLVALAQQGYFDRTVFHRIVPGFVIQGGDPTAEGSGGPGYQTVDIPPKSAKYTHGVVAMAKTSFEPPGTAGSQFFVVTADDAGLPPDYAIVGKVQRGMDVVDHIGKLGTATEKPTQTVEIEKATVDVSK